MSKNLFKLKNPFAPAGDQPKAIDALVKGLSNKERHQTLLGVTGSGKTFTAANVIAQYGKPTLVIAHNKTLAAQLAGEYREFFPENAVHYFVSYYDYYQPEAYVPHSDTYIEKEAQINAEIDRLRHASTQSLLTRPDTIIVASVSCIYGLGSPEEYEKENLKITRGEKLTRSDLITALVSRHFSRTGADLSPGQFRALGNTLEVMPVSEKIIYRFEISDNGIEDIVEIDAISRSIIASREAIFIFPAKHFVTKPEEITRALKTIKTELDGQLKEFDKAGKILEAERLKRRTNYDLALIREVGYVNGIENYSRHFSGKLPGEPPDTLLAYFPKKADGTPDFLTVIDESHVTLPQIRGMHAGDASRKQTLIEHGFRLPSARDNRPLTFDEFEKRIGPTIYTSATPALFERQISTTIVEQIIRPTGLIDPEVSIRPVVGNKKGYGGQIPDFIIEAEAEIKDGNRVIATTLTKKMAEDLASYLAERGIVAKYLHSDIQTLERIEIISDFRRGSKAGGFDCIVGVNLLREGLDIPEVTLIGIFDADREGFLRSETSLIQIIGRAARNTKGRVILYADKSTDALIKAMGETNRRRTIQIAYNKKHGITPVTIKKAIKTLSESVGIKGETIGEDLAVELATFGDKRKLIRDKKRALTDAVKELDFETASLLRDEILILEGKAPRGIVMNTKRKPNKKGKNRQ